MQRTFVDTSIWLALRDGKSPRHQEVVAWWNTVRGRLVTSSDVVDETVTWAKKKWGHSVAVDLGARLQDPDNVHLVHVDESFFKAGWDLFRQRSDKGYSLTDCTSFAIMDRMALFEAAALDDDFRQAGFEVVP